MAAGGKATAKTTAVQPFNGFAMKRDLRQLEESIAAINSAILELAGQEVQINKMKLQGETNALRETLRWLNTAHGLAKDRLKDAIQNDLKDFGPIGANCRMCRNDIFGYQEWELENPNGNRVHSKCWEKVYPRYVD